MKKIDPQSAAIGFMLFLIIWQLSSVIVDRPILPSPITVLPMFLMDLPGALGLHLLASAGRVFAAIGLAVIEVIESEGLQDSPTYPFK